MSVLGFPAGTDWHQSIQIVDEDGASVNLTGATLHFVIWRRPNVLYYDLTISDGITVTDAVNGEIEVTLTHDQTIGFAGEYLYELSLLLANADQEIGASGDLIVNESYVGLGPDVPGSVITVGATGATGETGATGSPGPAGPPGPPGEDGEEGSSGPPGPAGSAGAAGAAGATGATGARGFGPSYAWGWEAGVVDGWSGAVSAAFAKTGTYSLAGSVISFGFFSTGNVSTSGVRVAAGRPYTFSVWLKIAAGKTFTLQVVDPLVTVSQNFTNVSGDFEQFKFTWVPTISTDVQPTIGYFSLVPEIFTFYIDDAEVYPEPLRGPSGPPGPAGEDGEDGAHGPPGATGSQGPTGRDGPPGTDGEDGDAGPPGPAGSTGATGPSGPPGLPGEDGEDGSAGPPGAAGSTGATGSIGPAGPPGPAGEDGEDGPSGPPGAAGAHGNTGGTVYIQFGSQANDGQAYAP